MVECLDVGHVAYVFAQDNYDVDLVIGVQNIRIQDPATLAELARERLGPALEAHLRPGALFVGARNFGYGHPHVQSLLAIRQLGVAGMLADSFTPAFWRGGISNGFPLIACPGISEAVALGAQLALDWPRARVLIPATGKVLPFQPHTPFERQVLQAGGIVQWLSRQRGHDGIQTTGEDKP